MAAADPPPTSEGDSPEGDPGVSGSPPKAKPRRRVLVGRFRIKSPLPAIEIAGPPSGDPVVATVPRPEVPAIPAPVFDGILALAVLVLAAFLASFAAVNADIWLHLAAGRLVAHGQFPFGADPFSAIPTATWINHAWLFDWFLYLLYQPGGAALVAAKAGLVVVMTAVLLAVRRPSGGGLGPAAATTLVLLAASPLLALRSPVASYLLFAVLLLILHRRLGSNGRWQLPLTVGVLFAFWVNLDGGFVFGLLLLAVWTVGAILQRILPLGDAANDPGEASHPPAVLATAFLAAVVGCVLNPYHVRAFRLPTELTVLTLPYALRVDSFLEQFFREQFFVSPFNAAYMAQAGPVAAGALYVLLAAGLASFALNAGGWRWRRVLAWTAFACLGTSFGRTVPYLALVGGPALVLNLQAFLARRRTAWVEKPNPRADHLRAMLAATGRTGLLMAVGILLALAWPGWLGPDARLAIAPVRRVAWRTVPDPTQKRLADKLAGWYQTGELQEVGGRGLHLQPDFSAYCAWFCPVEKGVFDSRLTAPPEAIADYLALRRAVVAMGTRSGPEHHPEPPDPLLRKFGMTHMVLTGSEVLSPPPLLNGLGEVVFADPAQWSPWAIEGRGLICGWRNSHPKLRLDPIRLAVGGAVEPLSDPPEIAPPVPPTFWDRYRSALPPPPPEAAEAALWLAYREATVARGNFVAMRAWQEATRFIRLAPTGPPLLFTPLFDVTEPLQAAWRQSPEGRAGRAAGLLAIRTARRAILANPDHPQAYERLAQAYSTFETDPILGLLQELTAARQAVVRCAAFAPFRTSFPREEMLLQNMLFNLYQQAVIPQTQARPEDLILESLARFVDLRHAVFSPPAGADPDSPEVKRFEDEERQLRQEFESQGDKVRKLSDEYENATRDAPPKVRAMKACQYGLAREALTVLRNAGKDLDPGLALLMAHLFLLVGEAENARDVLQSPAFNPVEQLPPPAQMYVHLLTVQAAASLGDYPTAIDRCDAILALAAQPASRLTAQVLGDLVFPDAGPASPLTRVATLPAWGGLWPQGRPAAVNNLRLVGNLLPVAQSAREYGDWTVRKGLLALEAGDIPLARRQLTAGARGRMPTDTRTLAQHWLELWR